MNNGVDLIGWSRPHYAEILRVSARGKSTAGDKIMKEIDSVLTGYLKCFSSRPLSLPLFVLHPVTEVRVAVMVLIFVFGTMVFRRVCYTQPTSCVGLDFPLVMMLDSSLAIPGSIHLPSQTLLVTLGGFQWAQPVVRNSCFRHLS